jgi:putative DNA methylase
MESPKRIVRIPPKNLGLLELVRAKREYSWKPSTEELKRGFRGWHQRGYLPHFDAPGVTQFLTFQLHDSFPIARCAEVEFISKESNDSARRRRLETLLDRGHGKCWLRQKELAQLTESVLRDGNGHDYELLAWVIMPNHVHVVVNIWQVPVYKLINIWKGKSSREANQHLGRNGSFWQQDYYDTLVRDEAHLKRAIRYTEQNPAKAFLAKAAREWPWSSARYRDEYKRLPSDF